MDILEELFFDPRQGFLSQERLYLKAKSIDKNITRKQVKAYLENNSTNQLHRRVNKTESGFPIIGAIGHYQADLTFLDQYKNQNRGFHIIFSLISINNKYAFSRILKNKNQDTIISALDDIIKEAEKIGKPIKILQTDNGTEFLNNKMTKFLKEKNISQTLCQAGDKKCLSISERFNRTIKNYINKWMTANNSVVWYDKLDDFIYNYNNSYHSSIKSQPINLTEFQEKLLINDKLEKMMNARKKIKIKEGDLVRVPIKKSTFSKEQQNFSDKVYSVKKVGLANLEVDGLNRKIPINQVLKVPANSQEHKTHQIQNERKTARAERRIRQLENIEPNYEPRQYSTRSSKLKAYEKILS